jgi:ankyrin repeat protein
MHFAASYNSLTFMEFLLKNNNHYSIDITDDEGWTPVINAAVMNHFDALNLLIENGADLTQKNKYGFNSIDYLVRHDHADLLECIYPHYEEYEENNHKTLYHLAGTYSLLHLAAGNG